MSISEDIVILKDLGLSTAQAKVYWTLTRWDELSVETIAKLSKISRCDLYRVMRELESRGLVERILTAPIKFRAVAVNECVDVLIQDRYQEILDLRSKSKRLSQHFRKKKQPMAASENRFVKLSGRRLGNKINSSIERAHEMVRLFLSSTRFSYGVSYFSESMENAVARGVTWRVLTDRPEEGTVYWSQAESFLKKTNCKIKFVINSPKAIISIYDQTEVFIFENPLIALNESSALYSNNTCLIALAEGYFEMMWKYASEEISQSSSHPNQRIEQ